MRTQKCLRTTVVATANDKQRLRGVAPLRTAAFPQIRETTGSLPLTSCGKTVTVPSEGSRGKRGTCKRFEGAVGDVSTTSKVFPNIVACGKSTAVSPATG